MTTTLPPTWPDYLRGYAARQASASDRTPPGGLGHERAGAWLAGWSSADEAIKNGRARIDAAGELRQLEDPQRP